MNLWLINNGNMCIIIPNSPWYTWNVNSVPLRMTYASTAMFPLPEPSPCLWWKLFYHSIFFFPVSWHLCCPCHYRTSFHLGRLITLFPRLHVLWSLRCLFNCSSCFFLNFSSRIRDSSILPSSLWVHLLTHCFSKMPLSGSSVWLDKNENSWALFSTQLKRICQ